MEKVAESLPAGFSAEWTDIAFQQKAAGNIAALIFALSVVFVFLVLAAQFESLMLPLAIILIVPMTLLAAMAGVNLRGLDNNILTQIRSEEHTSKLQSLMRISYAVFCLKKKKKK